MKRLHIKNVRLTDSERDLLNETARNMGIQKSALLRDCIQKYCGEKAGQVGSVMKDLLETNDLGEADE